jgi:PLP dependent protein
MEYSVKDNLKRVIESIENHCASHGIATRPKLVAVTKSVSKEKIIEAYEAGQRVFGENYLQEALIKIDQLKNFNDIEWQFIGSLQSNKAKKVLGKFGMVQTVDRLSLASVLEKEALKFGIENYPVLVEINLEGEKSKSGVLAENLEELLVNLSRTKAVSVKGLMTIPPVTANPEDSRAYFIKLRNIRDKIQEMKLPNIVMNELSMGMSSDYLIAIEEGATMVRVGTAIFGNRN